MGVLLLVHSFKAMALIFFLMTGASHSLSPQEWSYFILWRVGQGQWATFSTVSQCIHFDIGGERVDWRAAQKECQRKENLLFISHGDWDHISFAHQARRRIKKICLKNKPTLPKKRTHFFQNFPKCSRGSVKDIHFHFKPSFRQRNANDSSHVFGIHGFLIPGDSTKNMEVQWAQKLDSLKYKVLVLGHHGSQTSTSNELLYALPYLRQAVVSSRKSRYGHPHRSVHRRLRKYGIPLISTEDWGTIRFQVR